MLRPPKTHLQVAGPGVRWRRVCSLQQTSLSLRLQSVSHSLVTSSAARTHNTHTNTWITQNKQRKEANVGTSCCCCCWCCSDTKGEWPSWHHCSNSGTGVKRQQRQAEYWHPSSDGVTLVRHLHKEYLICTKIS